MKQILYYFLFFVLIFTSSCTKEEDKPTDDIRPVKALTIGNAESTAMRIFPGVTLATNETMLAFQIPGQIIQFPVLEGDHVNKGKIIAELDPLKYQEKVNETQAKLIRDKSNFDRARELVKDGHLSIADYDKVKSAFLISQANNNTAKNDLDNTKLIAPFSGVIAKKSVKLYEYVTAKQPIILLQDTDTIDIEINVPENVIVSLKKQQVNQEKLFANFDAIPNQTFPIKLKEFSSQADAKTQTFRVVFTMQRPENFNILPGMTVSVHAALGNTKSENFYLIPSSAVFQNEAGHPSVWVIDKNTMKIKQTNVLVSTLSKDQIHLLKGVNPGDLIVISGVHFLHEGQVVKILK